MRLWLAAILLTLFSTLQPAQKPTTILIKGGTVVDGTGSPGRIADVRIEGDTIQAVGKLQAKEGEKVLDATNLIVAPGFIDAHSHTDGPMEKEPLLESQVRQGITTAIVGQDGGSELPIRDFFEKVNTAKPAINFATFAGHGTIRRAVMKDDFKRAAKDSELDRMKELMEQAMKDGALGLSTGLEYDPGFYATTSEVIELAKIAAKRGGIYISHTRSDGGGSQMQSNEELRIIAKEARIPAQISHIKLAVPDVWKRSGELCHWMDEARRRRIDITADVYPYLYWQSSITVLMSERDFANKDVWNKTFADIGGAQNVILTHYSPNPAWQGKDLTQIAKAQGSDPASVAVEIVEKTHAPGSKETESIVCKAMSEEDLVVFLKDPHIMFCSDGSHGGSHPRGAGSFPRIFGLYVRDKKVIPLEEAVRKATSLPAKRFGLDDRGVIKPRMRADIVVFDPFRIRDMATIENARAFSEGVSHVIVNGVPVLERAGMTGARPGKALKGHRQSVPISGLELSDSPAGRAKIRATEPHPVECCP